MSKKHKKLKTFSASYAYDVGCYANFSVQAASELAAKRKIQKLLREGKFNDVECDVNWDNISDHRVFVMGEISGKEVRYETPLEELLAQAQKAKEANAAAKPRKPMPLRAPRRSKRPPDLCAWEKVNADAAALEKFFAMPVLYEHLESSYIDRNMRPAPGAKLQALRDVPSTASATLPPPDMDGSDTEKAGMIYRFGNFVAELTYAITGTRAALTDDQLLATAREVRAAAMKQWRREAEAKER